MHTATTFTRARMPELRDTILRWDCPALDAHGEWTARQAPVHEQVYRGTEGVIDWFCLQPESAVRIRAGDLQLEGPGYAERLHMTVPPWSMPIDELRWGRYVAPGDSVIWIQWRGAHKVEFVYENGAPVGARRIADDAIELESGTSLSFDRAHVLRQGTLGSTTLAALPGLNRIVPARILQVMECKWLSRATLLRNGSDPRSGWAIHEVVRWP
jgi:hypothetical protein